MYLSEVANHTFVLLQADWSSEKARQLIERLNSTHIIVHRVVKEDQKEREYYYLRTCAT